MTNEEYMNKLDNAQKYPVSTFTLNPDIEPKFTIDLDTREIQIPEEFKFIGVLNDSSAETVYFEMDRYFDGKDLSQYTIIVQFAVSDKNKSLNEGFCPVTEIDIDTDPSKIIFGWTITNEVTSFTGDVAFSIRIYEIEEVRSETSSLSVFSYCLNTLPANLPVKNTLNVSNNISINYPSYLEQWNTRMQELDAQVKDSVAQVTSKVDEANEILNNIQEQGNQIVGEINTATTDAKNQIGQAASDALTSIKQANSKLPVIATGDAGKAVTIKQDGTGYEYTGPYAPINVQTELEDIRTGYDGTKYLNAGDAIREQFNKKLDKTELSNHKEINFEIGNKTYYIPFEIIAGISYTFTAARTNALILSTTNESSGNNEIESIINPLNKGTSITWKATKNAKYIKAFTNAVGSLNIFDNGCIEGKFKLLQSANRKFSPKFFHSIQSFYSYNDKVDLLKSKIDVWNEIGCDGYIICLLLTWDGETLTLKENLSTVVSICDYIVDCGKEVAAIKFHCTTYDDSEAFKTAYYNTLDELTGTTLTPSLSHTYNYIVFNECKLCLDRANEDWCISVINMIKNHGINISISYDLDLFGSSKVPNRLESILGFISFNYYPPVGNKEKSTTWDDYLMAWKSSRIIPAIKTYKIKYPTRDIWITETGVGDHYKCLAYPPKWDIDTSESTASNGITQGNYLKAAMVTVNDMVYSLTSWYEIDKQNTISILQKMLGKMW